MNLGVPAKRSGRSRLSRRSGLAPQGLLALWAFWARAKRFTRTRRFWRPRRAVASRRPEHSGQALYPFQLGALAASGDFAGLLWKPRSKTQRSQCVCNMMTYKCKRTRGSFHLPDKACLLFASGSKCKLALACMQDGGQVAGWGGGAAVARAVVTIVAVQVGG